MPRAQKGAARTQARKRTLRAARGYWGTKSRHKQQAKDDSRYRLDEDYPSITRILDAHALSLRCHITTLFKDLRTLPNTTA